MMMAIQWPARVKVVFVSADILTNMLTEGALSSTFECVEGLPEGAQIVGSAYDENRRAVALYFSHSDWPIAYPAAVESVAVVLQDTTAVPV